MIKSGCDVDNFIKIRRSIHSEPEGGFKEFKTQKKIIDALKAMGLKQS